MNELRDCKSGRQELQRKANRKLCQIDVPRRLISQETTHQPRSRVADSSIRLSHRNSVQSKFKSSTRIRENEKLERRNGKGHGALQSGTNLRLVAVESYLLYSLSSE